MNENLAFFRKQTNKMIGKVSNEYIDTYLFHINSIQKELEQSFIKKRNIVLNNKKIEQITPTKNCLNLIANTKK